MRTDNELLFKIIDAIVKTEPEMRTTSSGNFICGVVDALEFLNLIKSSKTIPYRGKEGRSNNTFTLVGVENPEGISLTEALFSTFTFDDVVFALEFPHDLDEIETHKGRVLALVDNTLSSFEDDTEEEMLPGDWEAYSGALFCFHELGLLPNLHFQEIMNHIHQQHGIKQAKIAPFVAREFGLSPSLISDHS